MFGDVNAVILRTGVCVYACSSVRVCMCACTRVPAYICICVRRYSVSIYLRINRAACIMKCIRCGYVSRGTLRNIKGHVQNTIGYLRGATTH